ncbi:MAG: T9SS type A sorting domain-containing protein [Bacteroidota bacterium]|nr:T9SS type A sorting domain-containing protein [Bacteroidota bacterium]
MQGLLSVNFFDNNRGIITGNYGVTYKTSDGGSNWIKLLIPSNFVTRNSFFINENTGWIIGNIGAFSNSAIYKTTNGGLNIASKPLTIFPTGIINYDTIRFRWNFSFYTTSYHLQISTDTSFTNTRDSNYIVNNFILLKNFSPNTTYFWRLKANGALENSEWSNVKSFTVLTSSIEPINNSIPTSLNLFQNYPNPFNPVTKIKFSVPENQLIKIKVYDIQGKEILELVNEQVQAGNYEIEFNGNNFSGGIYFYTLESESFKTTKKMVLIK